VAPRGRFDVELHEKFLSLQSGTQDFKIMYTNISRLFYLPATRHNHCMIALENPIRKGQSHYHHIIAQYDAELEAEIEVNLPDEKFEKFNGKLQKEMEGNLSQLFVQTLSCLSEKKIYKPSKTYHAENDVTQKYIRCSVKANDGFLFPCDKFFVFIYKPALVVFFDKIAGVEFERMAKLGGHATNTFQLTVSMKDGLRHEFNGIARNEYNNLFDFLTDKKIQIQNVDEADNAVEEDSSGSEEEFNEKAKRAARRERVAAGGDGDDIPDSEEEDDSYEDSGGEDDKLEYSESDSDEEEGAEGEDGDDNNAEKPDKPVKKKKEKKEKEKKEKEPKKRKAEKVAAEKPGKKKRAKKDKNAPKGAKGSYILFGMDKRPEILAANPGVAITEVAKLIGAAWKLISDEDKAMYNEKAQEDKERYKKEMDAYKAKLASEAAAAASDSDDDKPIKKKSDSDSD